MDNNTLLIILLTIIALLLILFVLGRIFAPIRKMQDDIKFKFKEINKCINNKKELKRKEIEQKRKEEYEYLKLKQKENELFIINTKEKLSALQKTFKEFEEIEKQSTVIYDELEEKTNQIEKLKENPSRFIFKIINAWKIKKLIVQCSKQKQQIEDSEKIIIDKKEEIKFSIGELLNSFN